MKLSLQVFNYLYLALAILWEPIQRGFLNIDGKGRIMFILTILIFFLNIILDKRFLKKEMFSKPAIFWGLWILFSAINLQFQGYYGQLSFSFYFIHQLFKPFLVMIIASKETSRDPDKVFKLFMIVFAVFAILSITILGGRSESHENRFTGELGNSGPLNTIYIIFFASLLFVHKKIKWRTLVPLMVFAFAVISMAATRKAFGAAVIIALTFVLSQIKLSAKNIIFALILSAGFYFGGNYALENTALGERFEEGMEVGVEKNTTNIKALSFVGDRVFFYIKGWEIFNNNMLTGIGLKNFMHKNHGPLVIHSEYMVQLAECGLIGSMLFLLFYFWIGKNLIRTWRKSPFQSRPALWILAGGFGAVLFINFTAWTYEFEQYFAAFGVMIGYIKYIQNNDSNTQHRQ